MIDGMQKEHLAKTTIKSTIRKVKHLARHCNLNNPEEIKNYLANKEAKNGYLESLAVSYNRYVRFNGLTWKMPRIKRTSQPPYVPTTEEITVLISDAGKKYALILSILRDTGMRPIELQRMKLDWYDHNRHMINVETAKYGLGRSLKLKESTASMMDEYLSKHNFKPADRIFPSTKTMGRVLCTIRKKTADKLKRPSLNKICMYSFRHYFASKLYQQTREYLLVKRKLGHKRIEQTITYIHLVTDGFEESDFVTATAETVKEACKLLEDGYDFVQEIDGTKIYRKRK